MSNLYKFTEMMEFLAKHHNFCHGEELKHHIPYFQGLNSSFIEIAKDHDLSCINFGIKNDPVLRGVELLYDLDFSKNFICPMRTHYNITNFTTREELSYLRVIQYLQQRFLEIEENLAEQSKLASLKSQKEQKLINNGTYTIAIRNKSIVLAFGEHSSEEDFEKLKKDRRGEHSQVIQRYKNPSIFISVQEILFKIASFLELDNDEEARIKQVRTSEREQYKKELQLSKLSDYIQDGDITIHIVGEYRHVSITIIFICLTFNFEIKVKKKEVRIPEALEVHQIESVICGYDLDVELRHSRLVNRLIEKWKALNRWGMKKNEESEALMEELIKFANDPLKIAIVGKSNVGKSTFLNALLQNDILPESHEACTGCVLEICYAETIEDETVELEFISKKELDIIIRRYKSEALAPDQAEYNELTGEREHWNPERTAALKTKIAMHKQFLKDISNEYAKIVKEYPNLIQYWDRTTPMQQFISDTAVNTSKARSRLIKSAHLFLHNPLLQSVTLVDTPGIGEDKLKGRDHLTEQAVRAADVHGWIYLTVVMDMEKNFKEDLKLLSEWSPNGIVCVTKFDQLSSSSTQEQKPIHEKLSGKINALKDDVLQRQIPAVSSLALFQMTTNFPKKSGSGMRRAEKLGQEVNRLIRSHIGEYIHTLMPEDHEDELSFDSDDISLARSCFDLSYRDWEDFRQLMCDLAIEGSLLMVLMNLVYDLIDKRFVVKRFDHILSEISTYLSRQLILLTDELQNTQDSLDSLLNVTKNIKTSNKNQASLNEFEQQINQRIRARQQLEEDCIARETEVEEIVVQIGTDICQKIAARFTSNSKSTPRSPGMFDKLKRLLSKPPEHLSLYKELDKKLASEVNSYLTNTMLCTPTVETLITNMFDSIKHNILLQVDRASMNINCLREANPNIPLSDRIDLLDTSSKEAQENFLSFIMDNARTNIKIIAVNARAHLNNVHSMIIGMVDKEITHLQTRLIAKRTSQQQEHVRVGKPIDVLQVKLDKTAREFLNLQKLYSAVMHIALQNTIKSNKISQVIQSRNTLSKPEREYVSRIMKIYLDEPIDEENDEENITLLDTYLSIDAVIKHISTSYAKLFTIITVQEYFKHKPDRVIVRHRRALSVFMQAFHMMISQVSLDGSQFHSDKDLEELFSSMDCKILCEKEKLLSS